MLLTLLLSLASQSDFNKNIDTWSGQRAVRTEWHDRREREADLSLFKRQYDFVDIAEEQWALYSKDNTKMSIFLRPTRDVPLSQFQLGLAFAKNPMGFDNLSELTSQFLFNIVERPADFVRLIADNIEGLLFPFILSLLVALMFHFVIWSRPMIKDLPRWLGKPPPLVVAILIPVAVGLSFISQQWSILLFISSLIFLGYSRHRWFPVILAILSIFIFSRDFLVKPVERSIRGLSLLESLEQGRTRLEYPIEDLYSMTATEKILWPLANRQIETVNQMLPGLPPSVEKDIISINVLENKVPPAELIRQYEQLRQKVGDHPIVVFNLIQLLTKTQQLLASDQMRTHLPFDRLQQLTTITSRQTRDLLNPLPEDRKKVFISRLVDEFSKTLSDTGIYPFQVTEKLKGFLMFFTPLFLFGFALLKRRKASGLCRVTGEPTISREIDLSSTVSAVQQRSDIQLHTLKLQIENSSRRYQSEKRAITNRAIWICPGLHDLYSGSHFSVGWLKTALCYFLGWHSLSPEIRLKTLEIFGISSPIQFTHPHFSMVFFVLFVGVYFSFIFHYWRTHS